MPPPSTSRPSKRYFPSRKNSVDAGSSATATRSRCPARSAASRIASIATSVEGRSGANPPSSPTAVASPRSCSRLLSVWKVSTPICSAPANDSASSGTSMNSWKSIEFCACTPPLITFSIGTGSVRASSPPSDRKSERPRSAAVALAVASETPRIAFAPSRALFGVPSSSINLWSSACWSAASSPCTASAISPLTFATARVTALPPYAPSRSRSSTASCTPVDAPDGTAARPTAPDSRRTSASSVGLPRESRTCRAWTPSMWVRVMILRRAAAAAVREKRCRARAQLGRVASSSERNLRAVEVRVLLVERQLRPRLAVVGGELLRTLDPLDEPARHRAQRELGVDVQPTRDVHGSEQYVAELLEHVRRRLRLRAQLAGFGDRLLQLAHLVVEVGERAGRVGVLEVHRGGAPLHLAGVQERGERFRHVVEDAGAALVLALDLLPALAHASRRSRLRIAEHVRMPPDELLVDPAGDLLEPRAAALLEQEREKVDLEQEVAQLVGELRVVVRRGCVCDLVRLLDRVRHDRPRRLLAVPRTVTPQPLRQGLEILERAPEVGHFVAVVVPPALPVTPRHGSGVGL